MRSLKNEVNIWGVMGKILNTFLELWFHSLANLPFLWVLSYQWSWWHIIDPDSLYFPQVSLQKRHHYGWWREFVFMCVIKEMNEWVRLLSSSTLHITKRFFPSFIIYNELLIWLANDFFHHNRLQRNAKKNYKLCDYNLHLLSLPAYFKNKLIMFTQKRLANVFFTNSRCDFIWGEFCSGNYLWNYRIYENK